VREGFAWRSAWALLRAAPAAVLEKIGDLFDMIKMRCADKQWRCRHQVLLPGRIVPEGELDAAAGLLVDSEFHKADAPVLKAIGVSDVPRVSMHAFPPSSTPSGYYDAMRQLYWPHLRKDSPKPHEHLIRTIEYFSAPHGWELVEHTSGRTQARICQHFLETLAFSKCSTVTFGHKSRTETYPQVKMVNPAVWSLLKSGVVEAHDQRVSVTLLAEQRERLRTLPSHPFSTWLRGIDGLVAGIPSEDYSTLPARRQTRADTDERPFWVALSSHCEHTEVSVDECRVIYECMADNGWYPSVVGTCIRIVDLKDCYVTQSSTLAEVAFEADVPAIVLSPRTATMWLNSGAQRLESHIQIETASRAEVPVRLIEVVPEFAEVLADETRDAALVRFVTGLAVSVAGKQVKKPCILDAGELLLDREQFDGLPWKTQIEALIDEAVTAKWFAGDAAAAIEQLLTHSVFRLRASVAEGRDLPDRLLLAVRKNPKQLLDSFDEGTRSAVSKPVASNGRKLAELALHVHGPGALSHLSEALKDNGLWPPERWGTQEARDFVAAVLPSRIFREPIPEAPCRALGVRSHAARRPARVSGRNHRRA
jgi:hypothetical protein